MNPKLKSQAVLVGWSISEHLRSAGVVWLWLVIVGRNDTFCPLCYWNAATSLQWMLQDTEGQVSSSAVKCSNSYVGSNSSLSRLALKITEKDSYVLYD